MPIYRTSLVVRNRSIRYVPDVQNLVTIHTLVRHCLLGKLGVVLLVISHESDSATVKDVHLDDMTPFTKVPTDRLFCLVLVR